MITKEQAEKLLTDKFTNVRKDALGQLARIIALQSDTEEEAQAAVDKLTDDNVNAFTKEYRSQVDKEVTDARLKIESRLKAEKFKKGEEVTSEQQNTEHEEKGEAGQIASVLAEFKALKEQFENMSRLNVSRSRAERLTEALNDCKDEAFKNSTLRNFGRMVFNGEDEFTAFIDETRADVLKANQSAADASLYAVKSPFKAGDNSTEEDDFVNAMKTINKKE